MKSFAYQAPTSLDQAVTLLAEHPGRARPLAGGTDLLVQLRLDLYDLDVVVDVKHIPELTTISFNADDGLTVGAAVPCAEIYEHAAVRQHYPALVDATSIIGGTGIQGRATLGGNLCNASPSGDTIAAMLALAVECTIAGPKGSRTIPVSAFCTGPRQTVLQDGELLVALHFPIPPANSGAHYLRFTPRREMDIAVAGVGASLTLNADHSAITAARLGLAAVGPTAILAEAAAASLIGQAPDEAAFAAAARLAQDVIHPITDVRGSAKQRHHLIGVLVKRALIAAARRAQGETV